MPTANFGSLIIMFAIVVKKRWHMQGFSVVLVFPHSPINKAIYVKALEGFPFQGSTMVLHLRKALYGTKQEA